MTTVKLVLVVGSIRISDLHHCDGSGSAIIAHGFRCDLPDIINISKHRFIEWYVINLTYRTS